jgi:hypothetical protein
MGYLILRNSATSPLAHQDCHSASTKTDLIMHAMISSVACSTDHREGESGTTPPIDLGRRHLC